MDRICRMGPLGHVEKKVWKTLMSIASAGTREKRSDRTLICTARFFCLNQGGQDAQDDSPSPPKTIGTRVAITIKVLTDLFSLLLR